VHVGRLLALLHQVLFVELGEHVFATVFQDIFGVVAEVAELDALAVLDAVHAVVHVVGVVGDNLLLEVFLD